jgi:protein-arginine kinase activator protein McsA
MQKEMELAVAAEAYERAAELRDAIRAQIAKKKEKSAELRVRHDE